MEKKLRAGFLINIFEDNLDSQLQKLIKIIPDNQPLKKDIKFTVALGLLPQEPVDGKLEKLYEKKTIESKSIIAGVEKGELIAQYILVKDGIPGRSCDGKFIPPIQPTIINPQPSVDETINEKILIDRIEYYANRERYPIVDHNNKIYISNNLQLKEATFKSTGTIATGDQGVDVSVNINHDKTDNEDAIGSGVKIDVKELSVNGSVASNVYIETEQLNIDAQTHSKSMMTVKDKATIKLHRGDLTAKEAEIDILESGKVTASKSVTIRQMLGGTVIAPIVKIDKVLVNTTIIASELIEINTIIGEHNKLIIDPDSIKSHHDSVEALQEEIKNKKLSLKQEIKDFELTSRSHNSKIDRMKIFQKRVLEASKIGKSPMKQDILRIKQFKKDSQKLALEKESFIEKEKEITNLEEELDKLFNKDLYAKVRSNTLYNGHTKVIFVNLKTKEEVFVIPQGKVEEISLVLNSQNERIISMS